LISGFAPAFLAGFFAVATGLEAALISAASFFPQVMICLFKASLFAYSFSSAESVLSVLPLN